MAEPVEPTSTARSTTQQGRPVPEQARIGLLNYLTLHSLDEDYAHVAGQRSGDGGPRPARSRRSRRLPTLVALVLFGAIVATAAVQTSRGKPLALSSRDSLVNQAQQGRSELASARREEAHLQGAVAAARRKVLDATAAGRAAQADVTRLGTTAGTVPVTGPGVRIVVDDDPRAATQRQTVLDRDLQILVNGLWVSGAEAVSINGQRLTNLSAVREAGDAITVNLRSLARPYVVSAVGDPDQLPARFIDSAAGSWWLNLRAVYHLKFSISREQSLSLPAAPDVTLRRATTPAGRR
ncbi:MAG: hypothetical protein QOK15_2734 [Nocardioidaceae bacterium]|jgi:uncharacterized protein YlxW (UPF0749 family)|nr:hypothetical protein [Nocardioidaceae bacterium]